MDIEEAISEQLRDAQLIKEEEEEFLSSSQSSSDNYPSNLILLDEYQQQQLPSTHFMSETVSSSRNTPNSQDVAALNRLNQEELDLEGRENEDDSEDSLKHYFPQNRRWKEAKLKAQINQIDNQNNNNGTIKSKKISKSTLKTVKGFSVKSLVAIERDKAKTSFEMIYGERPQILLNPLQGFYFLAGDVCIMSMVLKREEFARFSELNSFKSPTKTESNNIQGTLEIDVNNKRSGLKSFEFVIEKLLSLSDQRHYTVATLLQQYQELINNLQKKKSLLLNDSESISYFSQLLQQSYEEFLPKSEVFLKQIGQEYTFYSYTLYRLNLLNFEMEMKRFGYSEALLALLGLDFTQAQRFVWRRGLFDFLDKENIENTLFQLISHILGNQNEKQTFDSTLHTFDGIAIYAKSNFTILENSKITNPFLPYNEILHVQLFTISPSMIKQVIEIRQLSKEKSIKYIREIEEDLQYSMEATNFLEKYYNNAVDGFLPNSKRAKYRIIKNDNQSNKID